MDITIVYHSGEGEEWGSTFKEEGGRIVSAKLVPRSIKHDGPASNPSCLSKKPLGIPGTVKDDISVFYTYSVKYIVMPPF